MIVMSIAGVDPSAGAGVFADLKTFQAIGVYGTGIVTALTATMLQKIQICRKDNPPATSLLTKRYNPVIVKRE